MPEKINQGRQPDQIHDTYFDPEGLGGELGTIAPEPYTASESLRYTRKLDIFATTILLTAVGLTLLIVSLQPNQDNAFSLGAVGSTLLTVGLATPLVHAIRRL